MARAGEQEGPVRELGGQRPGHLAEAGQVVGVEVDDEAVRHERPVGAGQPLGLHRALDAALQLDGLEAGAEEPRGRTLEEAFEEPLDGGQRRHGRSRSLAAGFPDRRNEGRARPARRSAGLSP